MNTEKVVGKFPVSTVQLSQVKKQLNIAHDDFKEIIDIYQSTVDKNNVISNKLTQLKEKYNELIKSNTNKVFLFCLNSLYFQYKVLNFELENFTKINALIQNRMYGDYYKLYNIILSQCKDNNIVFSEEDFSDSARMLDDSTFDSESAKLILASDIEFKYAPLRGAALNSPNDITQDNEDVINDNSNTTIVDNDRKTNPTEISFPVYKDVDAFFRYRIEDIILIHQRILIIIHKLDDIYIQKEANIYDHKNNIFVGYSLSIFLNTLEYENEILKGQINLYIEYMSFYHSSQKTYLNNLLKKNMDFMIELDSNILVNTVSLNESMTITELSVNSENKENLVLDTDDETSDIDVIPPLDTKLFQEDSIILGKSTNILHSNALQDNCMDDQLYYDDILEDNSPEEIIPETVLDENPCGNVVIDNLSYNMLKVWSEG